MATTVLFLHGTAASGRMWAPYAAALGARALTPDLTGTRDHPIPRGAPVDLEADLAIALAAIDGASGLVDLVGHSYGGWLAMRAALARPERVRQVIAHDPTLWGVLSASDDDAITVPFQAMAGTSACSTRRSEAPSPGGACSSGSGAVPARGRP